MPVIAYLNFEGKCEEALAFYGQTLGAEVKALMRFSESPEPAPDGMMPPGTGHKVMHCEFRIADTVLMGSDCSSSGTPKFQGFSLTFSPPTPEAAEKVFAALADGGKVDMPLGKTFWSPCFGVVTDKFGVSWMVMVAA